jgi:hypothetical protein
MVRIVGARHSCLALIDNTRRKTTRLVEPPDRSWFTLGGKNMKKYVLLGVIALVTLLVIPAAMAAEVKVEGATTRDFTLTSDYETASLPLNFGWNYALATTLHATVTGVPDDWAVTVADAYAGTKGTNAGFMTEGWDGSGAKLDKPFKLHYSVDDLYYQISDFDNYWTGSATSEAHDVYVGQDVVFGDPTASYQITLTFSGGFV